MSSGLIGTNADSISKSTINFHQGSIFYTEGNQLEWVVVFLNLRGSRSSCGLPAPSLVQSVELCNFFFKEISD